jgi:hypothetical protein
LSLMDTKNNWQIRLHKILKNLSTFLQDHRSLLTLFHFIFFLLHLLSHSSRILFQWKLKQQMEKKHKTNILFNWKNVKEISSFLISLSLSISYFTIFIFLKNILHFAYFVFFIFIFVALRAMQWKNVKHKREV